MCGLVGMVFKAQSGGTTADANTFEQLLYIDALRGDDSTGVAALYNDGSIKVLKEAVPADIFRNTKEFCSFHTSLVTKGKAVIGHNRKKTIGGVSDETSHPFVIDNRYVFMHNGTLHSHKHLADTEVDSEALGIHLTKCDGDKAAIEEALSTVYGAYACAWFDQEKECLYLLRNKERPLHIAETTWGYIFCSEPGFIAAAAMRNYTKIESIREIPEDTLVTIDCTNFHIPLTEEKLSIKKSMPPATTMLGATDVVGINSLSKNALKRFRKNFLGRRLVFWAEDFIEKDINNPQCIDWHIWGENDALTIKHIVRGQVFNMDKHEVNDMTARLLAGIVESVDIFEGKTLVINVKHISPVTPSMQPALH